MNRVDVAAVENAYREWFRTRDFPRVVRGDVTRATLARWEEAIRDLTAAGVRVNERPRRR